MYLNTIHSKKIIEKLIWVVGPSRSGTTLVGEILASCQKVEYAFEPVTLYALLPIINKINKNYWKLIYETHVSEDLFFNTITGRKINLKKKDNSFFLKYKNKKEVQKKLLLNLKRRDLNNFLLKKPSRFLIKLPEVTMYMNELEKIYPNNTFVVMNRNYANTIVSMVKRGWYRYNDKNISSKFPMKIHKNKKYPYWLEKKYMNSWNEYNPYEKAAIYLLSERKNLKKINNKINLSYESILQNPKKNVMNLLKKIGLCPTAITYKIIKKINNKKLNEKIKLRDLKINKKIIHSLEKNE